MGINAKVSQTDFNALNTRVGTAESNITQNANAITTKVSQTDFNALGTRVGTAESTITQHSTAIASKVAQTDYTGNNIASLINQTATTIAIQANKINLVGAVTISAIDKSSVTPSALGAATPTDVSTAVDNIQIGGRNLFIGSDSQYHINIISPSSANIAFVPDNSTKSGYRYDITITALNNGVFRGYLIPSYSPSFTDLDGSQLTFSAKIKISTPRTFRVLYEKIGVDRMVNATTDYQEINLVGNNNGTYDAFYFGLDAPFQVGDVISICDMQLSHGNKAVDWSPAPEDVSQDAQNKVDELSRAHGGLTYLDAHSIYTGTLTANQVSAVAINAGSITTGILS